MLYVKLSWIIILFYGFFAEAIRIAQVDRAHFVIDIRSNIFRYELLVGSRFHEFRRKLHSVWSSSGIRETVSSGNDTSEEGRRFFFFNLSVAYSIKQRRNHFRN